MQNNRMEFCIQEAGCLLWLAPGSLGGLSPDQFGQVWVGTGAEAVQDLVLRAAIMPMSLYQDDGYSIRIVEGALTEPESAQWTGHVCWRLNVPCGKILISGCLSEDLEDDLSEFEPAADGGDYWLGCILDVPAGEYQVDVYSFPPGDLSKGWGYIADTHLFGKNPGIEPEKPLDYFRRTRLGEEPPLRILEEYDETPYINFIIQLRPKTQELSASQLEADGCLQWEFRKPEVCPIGIQPANP